MNTDHPIAKNLSAVELDRGPEIAVAEVLLYKFQKLHEFFRLKDPERLAELIGHVAGYPVAFFETPPHQQYRLGKAIDSELERLVSAARALQELLPDRTTTGRCCIL